MKARSRCAVPIPPASGSPGQLEFAKVFPWTSTFNAQRPTPNRYRSNAIPSLSCSPRCGFANRPNDRADDYHFEEAAYTAVNDQLRGTWLDRIDGQTHADRCDFQQNTKPNSRNHPAAGEAARINRHERENQKRLANNDPVNQPHHFTLRSPEIRRFCENVFEKNAVKQPAPGKNENVRGNECENESLHELLYTYSLSSYDEARRTRYGERSFTNVT